VFMTLRDTLTRCSCGGWPRRSKNPCCVRNVAHAGIFDQGTPRDVISDRIKTWNLAQLPELSNFVVT
jgi:hypothetical protein